MWGAKCVYFFCLLAYTRLSRTYPAHTL